MGFWPFGRDPANVELVSRVITAATQNGFRVRGKLTIHFQELQRQADADLAADRFASMAVGYLREQPDHGRVIGAEMQVSADLTARYPLDLAKARAVEVAALHVLGDPTLSDELRRASSTSSSSMPAVTLGSPASQPPYSAGSSVPPPRSNPPGSLASSAPGAPGALSPPSAPSTPAPGPVSNAPGALSASSAPGSLPPPGLPVTPAPPATSALPPPPRRRASSQIRSIQSLLMPPGTSPAAMGQFVAPLVRDSAARLLIGFLRAHDLLTVRGVAIDQNSAETLANLVPVSDAPPGGYEASRAGEIARWQTTLGQGVMFALQHEVKVVSAFLAKDALGRVEVMPALADAVVEAVCGAAFPDEAGVLGELGRFPTATAPDFAVVIAENLIRLAETQEDPASIAAALTPLLSMVQDDLNMTAMIIKASSGG